MSNQPALDTGKAASMAVLIAACLSTLVVNANTSAVSILLPAISEDTGMSLDTLQWAVTGYSLVGAAVIVTSGALADVFGRRLMFLLGIGLFVVSCVFIALSTSGEAVIIGRCIQGASGATILASGLSLITVASSGQQQTRAVALWGAASAVGAAAGPLVGGVLVEVADWQALFWLDAAIALICVPIALTGIEESNDPKRSRSIDYLGTVLVAATLVPIIYGMTKATDWGWISVGTISMFGLSAAAAAAFVYIESRVAAPLIDLKLLRNTTLVGSTLAILIAAGTINGLGYLLSIYFQNPNVLDMSPLQAGLAQLPMTVALVAITPLVTPLAVKLGTRQTISLGFIISGSGFLALAFVTDSWTYLYFLIPIIAVAAGMGLSNGPASAASTSCVDAHQVGAASGISNMARYVGAAVWVALVASIYTGVSTDGINSGDAAASALANGLGWACALLAASCAIGVGMGALARYRQQKTRGIDHAAAAAAHSHTVPVPNLDAGIAEA